MGGLGQQVEKGAMNKSNSPTAEPRVGLVSRLQRMPGTATTHSLQSQGRLGQQASKGVRDSSNSLPAEPRVGLVSRLKREPGRVATHFLQTQR